MMESKFRETFEDVLDGLESHVLTGEYIGESDGVPNAASG